MIATTLTRLAWIDALTPAQALVLFLAICAVWLAALVYAILSVRPDTPPSHAPSYAPSSRKERL